MFGDTFYMPPTAEHNFVNTVTDFSLMNICLANAKQNKISGNVFYISFEKQLLIKRKPFLDFREANNIRKAAPDLSNK